MMAGKSSKSPKMPTPKPGGHMMRNRATMMKDQAMKKMMGKGKK